MRKGLVFFAGGLGCLVMLGGAQAKIVRYEINGQRYSYNTNNRQQVEEARRRIAAANAAYSAWLKVEAERASTRIVAVFMVAIPASSFLGSPLSAALLEMESIAGLHGWQWMFILQAVPAVILGFVTLFVLRNGPDDVTWLAPEQRAWLAARLQSERKVVRHVDQL